MIYYGYGFAPAKLPQNAPYSTWAPQMWQQFNNLANNFKDSQSFANGVHNLGAQIPCPECKQDYDTYVQSNPPERAQNKQQATQWVNAYHQHVNQQSAKKGGGYGGWGWYGEFTDSDDEEEDDSNEWYSIMWSDLHGRAEDFDEDPYSFAPAVHNTVDNLPCDGCREHSNAFIQVNPPERIQSSDDAVYWMCQFHNWASIDAGNGLVDCDSDPQGNGYISGHHGSQGFYYGGGGGGGRGGGGKGGRGRGGHHGGGGGRGGGGGQMGGQMGGGGGGGGGRGGRHGHRRGMMGGGGPGGGGPMGMMGGGGPGGGRGNGGYGYYSFI